MMSIMRCGYSYDSTSIRRALDGLSKVIKVTVTWPANRSHEDLFTYLGARRCAASPHAGRPAVVT